MIAAGSLFTSCVENTEPQGIRDLREAKADYLASLSKLREADAEKVKAEAAYVQAQTATEQARAALVQAAAKAKEIANDKAEADNAIALEKAMKDAEVYLAQQELVLATAEENLRAYLVKVEEQSKQLTKEEKEIVEAYTTAYKDVIAKEATVREKEKDLYNKTYNSYGEKSVEAAKAEYEQDKALAEQSKAYWETVLAANEELSDAEIASYDEWVKKYDALKAEIAGFAYDKAEIVKDSALNEYENKAVLDSFYAAIKAKQDAITEATAPFKLEFTGKDKALALPKLAVNGTNVVTTFTTNVNALNIPSDQWVKVANDTLGIKLSDPEVAKGAVDTLGIIIDALKREQIVVDQLVKDTAGIAALVATTKHEYDSIKTVLEAGIAKFGVIAEKQKAYETAKKAREDKEAKYTEDTTKLFAAIDKFFKDWNVIASAHEGELQSNARYNDSLDIFNDLKAINVARKALFGEDSKFYFYKFDEVTGAHVKDSVETVNIDFKNLQKGLYNITASSKDNDGFVRVFEATFGEKFGFKSTGSNKVTMINKITKAELIERTNYFRKTFFDKYWVDVDHKNDIKVVGVTGDYQKYANVYVKAEKEKEGKALTAITTAKQDFYSGIYCTFWGIKYEDLKAKLNSNWTAFASSADSLKIVYTEKTFTEPTVVAKFEGTTGFFTPAEGKNPASIDFTKVNLKPSKALEVIEAQLGDNYLKPTKPVASSTYTLYAKYLATVQFANDAKNYKENTAALKELETVVATVKTAYDAAVDATKSGSALADSLITKLIGKPAKDVKATDYVVKGSQGVETFISKDGKGTFKLAGEQKELAEKWLADYAKVYSELEAQKAEIKVTISDNNTLANIYSTYIMKPAELGEKAGDDPDEVLKSVKGYWYGYDVAWKDFFGRDHNYHVTGVLEEIQSNIDAAAEAVKVAEAKLAKLEAGYDQSQIDIESAQDDLEKALAELKQAELEFAVAEEAYKAVLAAHGITE